MSNTPVAIESLVLKIVSAYLSSRLASKYDLAWKDVKEGTDDKGQYNEKRSKLAREAFLATRARTGADFIDYFVSTLCSVPQRMTEEAFLDLSRQLHQNTDHVRTLTLLALSARS
jgi:CRISPR-associated protein Cmx8